MVTARDGVTEQLTTLLWAGYTYSLSPQRPSPQNENSARGGRLLQTDRRTSFCIDARKTHGYICALSSSAAGRTTQASGEQVATPGAQDPAVQHTDQTMGARRSQTVILYVSYS